MRKNRKRSPFPPWYDRILAILRAALRVTGARLRVLAGRLAALIRTLRTGPLPDLDGEDGARAGASLQGTPVQAAEATFATEDGAGVAATTIVPSTRWEALDRALGQGRERWRNLATAGVAVLALVVAVSVLWSSGDDEDATLPDWSGDGPAALTAPELVPSLVFDEPGDPVVVAAGAVDEPTEDEDEPLPDGVPSHIAYGEPAAAPPSDPPARALAVAGAQTPPPAAAAPAEASAAAPAAEAPPEPALEVTEIDPDEARELARKAGCPEGTLPTEVLAGDTVRTIAWRHAGEEGRNLVPRILQANRRLKPSAMQPGDLVCVPDVERVIVGYQNERYEIRRGDTISGLAERFQHLSKANVRALTARARKKDMLFAGREVTLPIPQYAVRL